jgi:hypothetical protein
MGRPFRYHGALQFEDRKCTEVHGCLDEWMLSCGGEYIYDDLKRSNAYELHSYSACERARLPG